MYNVYCLYLDFLETSFVKGFAMNHTHQGSYACMAPSVSALEGRCRKLAKDDGFCHSPHGPDGPIAEPGKVVLFRFRLDNDYLKAEAEQLGFEPRQQSVYRLGHRREMEGSLLQRSLHAATPAKGNGCSVFGHKPVLGVVKMNLLAEDLEDSGFELDGSIHTEKNPAGEEGDLALVVRFRHKSIPAEILPPQEMANTEEQFFFLRDLMRQKEWRVNVFDNIPRCYVQSKGFTFQFQSLENAYGGQGDKQVKVLMLNPAKGEMEVAPEFFNRAIRFSTSVITSRVPRSYGDVPTSDMVKIDYNEGSWALRYALPPRWKSA